MFGIIKDFLFGTEETQKDTEILPDYDYKNDHISNHILKYEDYQHEYNKPAIYENIKGDYLSWWNDFKKEPRLVTCISGRRKGKDLTLNSIGSSLASQTGMMVYIIGNEVEGLPNYITVVDSIEEVPNDSIVIIGESGIEYNSRQSMGKKSVGLGKLLSVISHKGLWVFVASQTGRKLDVNLIAESDCIILLEPSLMMTEMERPVVKKLYKKYQDYITKWSDYIGNKKGVCVVYSKKWEGVCRFKMPSWWTSEISTSYKDKQIQ